MIRFLFLLLFSLNAFASLNNVDKAYLSPNSNKLANPGFENGKAQWTASAGTFTTSSTSPIDGGLMGVWDAAASADTLTATAVSLKAGNIVGFCKFQVPSGTATHTLQLYDGANILASSTIISTTSVSFMAVNAVLASDDDINLRIYANADEPSINIDDCYLGPADGLNVFLSNSPGIFSAAVSSTDVVSKESPVDWISGNCTNASAGKGTCTFVSGIFTEAPNCWGAVQIDSTNAFSVQITSISASALTFESAGTAGAVDTDVVIACQKTGADAPVTAFRADMLGMFWAGIHDSTCSWSKSSGGSYGDPTGDPTCNLTPIYTRNLTCVSTADGTGNQPGLTCTFPRAGYYDFSAIVGFGTSAASPARFQMIEADTSTVISTAIGSNTANAVVPMLGTAYVASAGTKTVKIQTYSASSTVTMTGSTSQVVNSITWNVKPTAQFVAQPAVKYAVVTSSDSVFGSEVAELNCDAASSVTSESGDWISAIGNRSGASCALTINSGIFSATPYSCQVTKKDTSGGAMACSCSSSTSCTVYGPSAADFDAYVHITGPR